MAKSRDERVSEALAWAVAQLPEHRRWLVVDDRGGRIPPAIPSGTVEHWNRAAYGGAVAQPEPPSGPFDAIVVRLPRGTDAVRMVVHQLRAVLDPGGILLVGGANDEGIRPVGKRLEGILETAEVVATRRHCRVFAARGPTGVERGRLEDWSATVRAEVAGVELEWTSWPSLFAHGRLDAGTRLLLETLPPLSGRVLDFATGAGVVAQFLDRRGDPVQLELSDVDALATHAAAINVPTATVTLCDGLPVSGGPWSAIVSNPPVHLGKEAHRGTLQALAATAPHRLRRGGALWTVVQGTVPVHKWWSDAFGKVERVARNASYAVWRART